MQIVYNPKDGAPITRFVYQGELIEPHYPHGKLMTDGTVCNGLKQYEDHIAEAILETFGFLEAYDETQAKRILEAPVEETFKCDFPGCEFVATKKIGLLGHQRGHAKSKKSEEKPVVDEKLIPVAKSKKVESVFEIENDASPIDGRATDIQNGTDKDGVEWFGEGVQVENKSAQHFGPTRGVGKGHFAG